MFRIITVEREYGAGGSLVAAELARRKGWQLLDQQLTCEIAKMAAVEESAVASAKKNAIRYCTAWQKYSGGEATALASDWRRQDFRRG